MTKQIIEMPLPRKEVENTRIILMNTMGITFQDVPVPHAVHFGGRNGRGKTSFLRVGVFPFIGTDRKRMDFDETQKGFIEYYFPIPEENGNRRPYIVYEYCRTQRNGDVENKSYFIVVVYRPNTDKSLNFIFADCAFDPNLFFDNENRIYFRWQDVAEKIKQHLNRDQSRYYRAKSFETYQKILFGINVSEQRNELSGFLTKYSIFSPQIDRSDSTRPEEAVRIISRTISRIVLPPSKSRGDNLNGILESIFPSDSQYTIRYERFRDDLETITARFDGYERWNGADNKDDCRMILRVFPQYEACAKLMKQYLSEIKYAYLTAKSELVMANETVKELSAQKEGTLLEKNTTEEQYKSLIRELESEISVLKDKIRSLVEDAEKYNPFYARKDEFESLESRRATLVGLRSTLAAMTAPLAELDNFKAREQKKLEEEYESFLKSSYSSEKNKIESDYSEACEKIENERRISIEEYYSSMHSERDSLNLRIGRQEQELKSLRDKLGKFDQYHPFAKEIGGLRHQKEKAESSLKHLRKELSLEEEKLSSLNARLSSLSDETSSRFGPEEKSIRQKLDYIEKDIEKLEKNIEKYDASFAGWLDQNIPGWETSVGKIVRRELLMDPELEPVVVEDWQGCKNVVCGVEINVEGKSFPVPTKATLEQNKLEREAAKLVAEKELSALLKKAKEWEKDTRDELSEQAGTTKTNVERLQNEIGDSDSLISEFTRKLEQLYSDEREKRAKDYSEAKQKEDKLSGELKLDKDALAALDAEQKEHVSEIEKEFKARKDAEKEKKSSSLALLEEKRNERLAIRDNGLVELERVYKTRLAEAGVDNEKIESLQKDIAQKETAVRNTEIDLGNWYVAKNFFETEYVTLPGTKETLGQKTELLASTKEEAAQADKQFAEKLSVLDAAIKEKTELASLYANDIRLMEAGRGDGELATPFLQEYDDFEEYPQTETTSHCEALIDAYRREEKSGLRNEAVLKDRTNNILNRFPQGLRPLEYSFVFGEKRFFSDREMADVRWMYDYIAHERFNERVRFANNGIRVFMRQIIEISHNWESYVTTVKNVVRNLKRELKEANFVSGIRSIDLKVEDAHNSFMAKFALIRNRFGRYAEYEWDSYNFFAPRSEPDREFLRSFASESAIDKEGVIRAIDTIMVYMKVDEGKQNGQWTSSFHVGGSSGTQVLAKDIFFIVLLQNILKKYQRAGTHYRFPFLWDETGTIYTTYVEDFMLSIRRLRMNFITCQPNPYYDVDPTLFDAVYFFADRADGRGVEIECASRKIVELVPPSENNTEPDPDSPSVQTQ